MMEESVEDDVRGHGEYWKRTWRMMGGIMKDDGREHEG